jgi:hypothetical protein
MKLWLAIVGAVLAVWAQAAPSVPVETFVVLKPGPSLSKTVVPDPAAKAFPELAKWKSEHADWNAVTPPKPAENPAKGPEKSGVSSAITGYP